MTHHDDRTPERHGDEPEEAVAADATAAMPLQDEASHDVPTSAVDEVPDEVVGTGPEADDVDAPEDAEPDGGPDQDAAVDATAHDHDVRASAPSRPEPEIFESEDFAGATPPPSLQERAAQMRRERLARYRDEESSADEGPETQAMDAVRAAPSHAATTPAHALTPDAGVPETTGPIQEPQEPPFATTAQATATEADPAGRPRRDGSDDGLAVPGVTDEVGYATAAQPSRVFSKILQWVVAILTPFVVLIGAVRAVASGAFLWIEYHRPGFPVDVYGFDTAERTTLGSYGLNYINGFAGSSYLGDLQTPEGARSLAEPNLFKATEVQHMADVQALVHVAYLVGCLALLVIVISVLVLRVRYAGGVRRGLFAGAWATLGVLLVLGVMGVQGWNAFFTDFHRLFFSGGNWEFYMDDTLIRLYPPQFWVDAAIVVAGIGVLVSAVLLWATWPTRTRRAASRNKQNARLYRMG
jgi:integral membrane protein (TIGR01906 family)